MEPNTVTIAEPKRVTITVTVGSVVPDKNDPSGGPGKLKEVILEPVSNNPLHLTHETIITFLFAPSSICRTFTDFRYIRSCDTNAVAEKYVSLGTWFHPADQSSGSTWNSNWTEGQEMTGVMPSAGLSTMIVTDRDSPHTAGWTYLYVLEWKEGTGSTKYVCDPKIYQSPSRPTPERDAERRKC